MEGGFTYNNLNQEMQATSSGPRHTRTAIKEEQTLTQRPIATVKSTRVWTRMESGDWEYIATPYFREVNMNFVQHFCQGSQLKNRAQELIQLAAFRDLTDSSTFLGR